MGRRDKINENLRIEEGMLYVSGTNDLADDFKLYDLVYANTMNYGVTGSAILANAPVTIGSSGLLYTAKSNVGSPVIGIAKDAAGVGALVYFYTNAVLPVGSTIAAGKPYFINSVGSLVSVKESGVGSTNTQIGMGLANNKLLVNIGPNTTASLIFSLNIDMSAFPTIQTSVVGGGIGGGGGLG